MKRLLFLFASIAIIAVAANAQIGIASVPKSKAKPYAEAGSGFHFGAGLSLGLPIGDWSDFWSFGIGVEAQGEYMFSEKFSGVFNSGYTSFLGKDVDLGFGSQKVDAVGLIPILAGVRVYPATQFFIGARAGIGILTGGGSSTSVFQYRPEIGYNGGPIQIALAFNGMSKNGESNNYIGLTALYIFGATKE
jgi:hypothetical protein